MGYTFRDRNHKKVNYTPTPKSYNTTHRVDNATIYTTHIPSRTIKQVGARGDVKSVKRTGDIYMSAFIPDNSRDRQGEEIRRRMLQYYKQPKIRHFKSVHGTSSRFTSNSSAELTHRPNRIGLLGYRGTWSKDLTKALSNKRTR